MLFQPPLPTAYYDLTDDEIHDAVNERRRALGRRLVILGHHYQQDDVIQHADFTGDSLKLSQIGASQDEAEFIVFCGVHFMAESADILSSERVRVVLPDLSAGCSMADMADLEQLEDAWDYLASATDARIVPITYVNSSAKIKAFCGHHGGACCTSSNARSVLEWAWGQGDKILFLPDQHLGRNTAFAMGIALEDMVVYDPKRAEGGMTPEQAASAKVFLWNGHCSVHSLFTLEQCEAVRQDEAETQIIVHPECPWEVVQRADFAGSTEFIIKTITEAPAGSRWAVGTEVHLVDRLARRFPEKNVRSLAGIQCLCTTMYRIDPKHLLWALDALVEGRIVNQVSVPAETKRLAIVALNRMLENVPAAPVAIKAL